MPTPPGPWVVGVDFGDTGVSRRVEDGGAEVLSPIGTPIPVSSPLFAEEDSDVEFTMELLEPIRLLVERGAVL